MSLTARIISETIRSISQNYHNARNSGGTTQLQTQAVIDQDPAAGYSWFEAEFEHIITEWFSTGFNTRDDKQKNIIDEEERPSDYDEDLCSDFDFDIDSDIDSDTDSDIQSEHLNVSSDEALCRLCVDTTDTSEMACCLYRICDECLGTYFVVELMAGKGRIDCPNCSEPLGGDFIDGYLSDDSKVRLNQNKVDSTLDPNRKTCPGCKLVTNRSEVPTVSKGSSGMPVTCGVCDFQWCFECHGPNHEGTTCSKAMGEGDAQLKRWAKRNKNSQKNARRCPGCKSYVQRSDGCDHMECRCGTKFCYKCGKSKERTTVRRGRCKCDLIKDTRHYGKLAAIGSGVIVGGIVVLPIVIASIPFISIAFGVRKLIKKKRRRNARARARRRGFYM